MPKVTFVNEKQEIEVPDGRQPAAGSAEGRRCVYPGVNRYLNCRGLGLCGTCRVLVKKGMENLSQKTLIERVNLDAHPLTMLAAIGHEDEMRLSCQVQRQRRLHRRDEAGPQLDRRKLLAKAVPQQVTGRPAAQWAWRF